MHHLIPLHLLFWESSQRVELSECGFEVQKNDMAYLNLTSETPFHGWPWA